jgi:hypothetical protein
MAAAQAPAPARAVLPFHLSISPPVVVDPRSLDFDYRGVITPGHYDPTRQMWVGTDGLPRDVRASSHTTCQGISGTNIGGIIFSDRHTGSDD